MSQSTDSFLSHLLELRDRLLRIVIGFVVCFVVLVFFANNLYTFLAKPLLDHLPNGGQMIATAVTSPILVPMKVAMLAAIVVSLPFTLYQIWAFIAPGLYKEEKRLALPMVFFSTILFMVGMAFAYFIALPQLFKTIANSAPKGVTVMTDISSYLDFIIAMFIAFGLAFEVPMVVVVLVRMGIVPLATLKDIRGYVIVGAFIIGAICTPPDIFSQVMLAVPLWLLYEIGLVVATLTAPKTSA